MKIYYDNDADPKALAGKRIAVIGYGSQGFGHSNNLKDSGCDVIVGLRSGSPSVAKAQSEGLEVLPVADAAERGDRDDRIHNRERVVHHPADLD